MTQSNQPADPNVRLDLGGWISGMMLPRAEALVLTGLTLAHGEHQDIGEFLGRVLSLLADSVGGTEAVLSNRSGSWEAGLIRQLLAGTRGDD